MHVLRVPFALHLRQWILYWFLNGFAEKDIRAQTRRFICDQSRGPWKLIYYEAYTEREDAEGREKYLKSGAGRRFLRSQLRYYLKKFPARAAT
ncbi:MAG: hypothetical protein DMF13_08100 [Verrucomicrobia bacterium]|nr:MAG: hypothetical protein DMF13_08100 [Verrucomicrobiota bacterium]